MNDAALYALALTLLAGLSTGLGGVLALLARREDEKFLSASLGFSAGVMIYVSLVEMLATARETASGAMGESAGGWLAVAGFFGGILVIAAIDRLVPSAENPHEVRAAGESPQLKRVGAMTAAAIAIHNFPEGLATFVSALGDPGVAVPVAAAIALHNVPEGIAVAAPVYRATGSRRRALRSALLSGLAEPAGALLGWLALRRVMSDALSGAIFAAAAGIMVFISLDELLPAARAYGEHHLAIYGLVAGMAVMAVSLLVL